MDRHASSHWTAPSGYARAMRPVMACLLAAGLVLPSLLQTARAADTTPDATETPRATPSTKSRAAMPREDAPVDLARLLPPETLAYLRLPDWDVRAVGYRRSILKQVADLPDMQVFLRDCAGRRAGWIQQRSRRLHLPPVVVEKALEGQVSMALLSLERWGGDWQPTIALSVRFPQPIRGDLLFDRVEDSIERFRAAQGPSKVEALLPFKIAKITVRETWPTGHEVLTLLAPPQIRFVLLDDRTLLIYRGNAIAPFNAILARQRQATPGVLRDSPTYRRVAIGAGAHEGCHFLYVNTRRLRAALADQGLEDWTRLLDRIGGDGLEALGVAMGYHHDGRRYTGSLRHTLYALAPRDRRGGWLALAPEAAPGREAERMLAAARPDAAFFCALSATPAEAVAYLRAASRLLNEGEHPLARLGHEGLGRLLPALDRPETAAVMRRLRGQVMIERGAAGPVLRCGLDDVAQTRAALDQVERALRAESGKGFRRQTVAGVDGGRREILYSPIGGVATAAVPALCIDAPAGKPAALLVATHPQAIRALLRQPVGGGLLRSPQARRSIEGMRGRYGAFVYIDTRRSFQRVWDLFLSTAPCLNGVCGDLFDPGRLPLGEDLAGYMGGTALGVAADESGVRIDCHGPIGMGGAMVAAADGMQWFAPAALGMAMRLAEGEQVGAAPRRTNGTEPVTERLAAKHPER